MRNYKLVPVEPTYEMALAAMNADTQANYKYGKPADFLSIWSAMLAAAPAVQGEPVGEVRFELGAPSSIFAELYSKSLPVLAPGTKLYTTPQPAEQKPAPGAAGLVEALTELCDEIDKHEIHAAISKTSISWFKRKARKALAAHRKQEGGV